MSKDELVKLFAYAYFICVSICLLTMMELLIFGKTYFSLFLIIYFLIYGINLKIFKKL
jgi:hypothetical protein